MYDGDLQYLKEGNPLQKSAYKVLHELEIMHKLAPFNPLLCGTVPLNIQTRQSDLDIICEVNDFDPFADLVSRHYGHFPGFSLSVSNGFPSPALTARFSTVAFPIEIFGQSCPVRKQHAYRHMVQEGRVLALAGEHFREQAIRLKESGLSTEVAFARLLDLPGDPYEAILSLEQLTDTTIASLLN